MDGWANQSFFLLALACQGTNGPHRRCYNAALWPIGDPARTNFNRSTIEDIADVDKERVLSLKSLIVFIEPSSVAESRLRYAVKLALQHHAHLIGVFIVPKAWDSEPADCYIRGADAIRNMLARHEAAERDTLLSAGRKFEQAAGHDDFTYEFRVIRDSDAGDLARVNCLHSDLVIVGHPLPGGLPKLWSPERMLISTGVPFLIIPDEWQSELMPTNVLLAWNASREARRAISDSLAILMTAQSVAVVVVDPERNLSHGEEPGADIAHFLSRHGVVARVEQLSSNQASVADTILDYAARDKSDLIVLGAYSHSQTRERLFGGVTRSLLKSVTIPTLISH